MIYPITPKGHRGTERVLAPGEDVTFAARIGGVYVVESRDGKIHQIHSPSVPTRTVILQ